MNRLNLFTRDIFNLSVAKINNRSLFGTIKSTSSGKEALSMIGKTYSFFHKNPLHPSLADLGICRVVSVVFNEGQSVELGLLSTSADLVEFIPMIDLDVKPSACVQSHFYAH